MKVRGAVLREMGLPLPYELSRPLRIEELELSPPGPGEVLVRIRAAGLCHSDLSVINGDRPRPLPMLLGHEAAGEVAGLGEGVADLALGDSVVMVFVPSCGCCLPCSEGRPALCEPGAAANLAGQLLSGARRIEVNGAALNHHLGCSAFAEYAVVSRRSLVKVDRELPHLHAALFGCAVLTGVGAVVNTAHLQAGQTAAVIGLGGVGLAAILGAACAGAQRIVAIDVSPEKLELATSLGATDAFNASDAHCADAIRELLWGGVDFAFEFAGSAKAMDLAYRITRRGGTTVTASLPKPSAVFGIPHVNLVAEERTIKGSYIGTAVPMRDIPRYVALFRRGRLPVDRLLSSVISLDQVNEGFDRLAAGKAVRQIIQFS